MSQIVLTTGCMTCNLNQQNIKQRPKSFKPEIQNSPSFIIQSMVDLPELINWLFSAGVAVCPIIGFIFQYFLIRRRRSIGSFSIHVCGILLLSNLLKIGFFIYKAFSYALLLQALLMIAVQFLLLKLCIQVMHQQGIFTGSQQKQEKNAFTQSFWKWKNFTTYTIAIALGTVLICSLSYLILQLELTLLGELVGYLAMAADTCLLLPQLIQNLKQSRVKGVSYLFVFLNALQDLFQLAFVLIYSQPFQYILLNAIQLLADFALVFQIVYYKCLCPSSKTEEFNEQKVQQSEKQEVSESSGTVNMQHQETISIEKEPEHKNEEIIQEAIEVIQLPERSQNALNTQELQEEAANESLLIAQIQKQEEKKQAEKVSTINTQIQQNPQPSSQ